MSPRSFPRADALLAGVRRYLALRAATAFALWIASGIALLLLAGWLLAGPQGWRQGTPGPLILDLTAMLCGGAGVVAVWRGWVVRLTDRHVTSAVEHSAGLAEGAFLGAVELARATPLGTSAALARLAEAGVSARVRAQSSGVLAGALGDRVLYWRRMGVVAFAGLGLGAALVAWSAPERAKSAWTGLLYPLRALAAPVYAALEVEPGDVDVARGASVAVRVRAPGRERVTLRWQAEGDVARIQTLSVVNGAASFTFDSVTAAVQYGVSAPDGARTSTYRIRPVDPLFLSQLDVGVFYPEYTGRPAEEFSGLIPTLEIPAGTRLRIAGRTSRELGSAALAGPSGNAVIAFRVAGAAFQGEWRPRQSGSYTWQLADATGAAAPAAHAPLEIRITTDASPEVQLVFPGKDTLISVTLRQPLVIQASDDYGLEQLELIGYRVSSFGERGEQVTARFESEGAAAVELRPVLDVNEWGLLPGDTVRYFARVLETGPERKTAQTREFALRLPSISELRWDAQRDVEQLGATLQDLAARMEAAQREASVQARRAATSANQANRADARSSGSTGQEGRAGLDYSQTEDARRAVAEQEQILAQLDSLRLAASQLLEALQQAGLSDTDLRRRLAELQELLSEVAEGELQANLERAADALQSLDPEELRRALDALAQEQQGLRERLDEALERFRRAAVEQRMRTTAREASELARQEQALAEEMGTGRELAERAEQQQALQERTSTLREELQQLDTRLEQVREPTSQTEAQRAAEMAAEAQRSMSTAAEAARAQNAPRAEANAQQAANQMQQAAETLENAVSQMTNEAQQAAQAALDQAATDALALARLQASVLNELSSTPSTQLREASGAEAAILQGARQAAESLAQAARESAMIEQGLSQSFQEAMESLERALAAMSGDAGPARAPRAEAEAALEAFNEAARQALASGAQMSGSQGGPGLEQALAELAKLAGQQGNLYQQSGGLAPLQLSPEALAQQLQQLAALQREVGQGLDELSAQPEENTRDLLGDLGAMAQEAEALARRLEQSGLDRETIERQGRLFHRLLDAGRTLERDEFSEERESRTPGRFDPRRPPPLDPRALGGLRFVLPDAAELARLSPAQRQMVLEYFERLNRSTPER